VNPLSVCTDLRGVNAVIAILAVVAKQENLRRSERILAGLARAKRNGSNLGRPHVSNAKASRTTSRGDDRNIDANSFKEDRSVSGA
jgi:DNA invertase Pin-like site-specific DNA recombinase